MDSMVQLLMTTLGCLLVFALVPSRIGNAHQRLVRQLVTGLIGLNLLLASLFAIGYIAGGQTAIRYSLPVGSGDGVGIGIFYDGATCLMLVLVSFIGLIVSRFSIRYLDGEATQGRYFRWLAFTVAAVSLLVVAGNLLMFMAAWVMTSFGLHQLLMHYRHRPAARRAAWTKFTISRLGDAFLVAALVLTMKTFGTLELSELFAMAKALSPSDVTVGHAAIGWLLMLGAVTKSAQFPFHTWLPDTMETPTPVSALMHAGVVNAGGYLVIRMSPLVALAPSALMTLAVIGAFTACFAGVVMMTQPSIKRSLAYSTIAQMGFMMLQCGIGAFSAAMLHIIAHSLYKAHAFLSSGSVISQSKAMQGVTTNVPNPRTSLAYFAAAGFATLFAYFAISAGVGIEVASKPGGLVLAFIVCLALTTWGWRLLSQQDGSTAWVGLAGVGGLCSAYVGSYLAVDSLVGAAAAEFQVSATAQFILFDIALAFVALFVLHVIVFGRSRPTWLDPLRVHVANGFYVDAIYRRAFSSLAKS